ncbi:MAG: DUF3667 domain-containing protein [Flavobacterium sp.]
MNHTACLNCDTPVNGKFCSNCGQKTDTHRITLKHFIFHDILHGVWHFEKGILFTMKQAMLRPGKSALDYIAGKRIRFYNVFYLTLLLIGLNIFLSHIQTEMSHEYFGTRLEPEMDKAGKSIDQFLGNNSKLIIFSFIPLLAVNSFIFFRRKKLNFSEHFIISGMMFLGVIIISTVGILLYFADYVKGLDFIGKIANFLIPLSILVYLVVNYYRTFSENYTWKQNIFRVSVFMLMLLFEIVILLVLMVGYFTHWKYELQMVY